MYYTDHWGDELAALAHCLHPRKTYFLEIYNSKLIKDD
jgi:hypothetical protein